MDQDGTWHRGGPRSRTHCARWELNSSCPKRGHSPPIFSPFLLWSNCWMHQDATCYRGRPQPRPLCGRKLSFPQLSAPKMWGGDTAPSNFWPMSIVAKRLDGSRCHWVRRSTLPQPHCVRLGPSSPRKGHSSLPSFRPMSTVATVAHLSYC